MAIVLAGGLSLLSVTASPPYWSSSGHSPFTTGLISALVAGGSGSYSYSWTRNIDTSGTCTINSPASQSTTLTFSGLAFGDECSGTLTCTVTDTVTGLSASVDVPFSHFRS